MSAGSAWCRGAHAGARMPKMAFPWYKSRPGEDMSESDIAVKVLDSHKGTSRFWSEDKFMDRFYSIRDIYGTIQVGPPRGATTCSSPVQAGQSMQAEEEEADPFADVPEDRMIGHCRVYLESLYFLIDIDTKGAILDYKGAA